VIFGGTCIHTDTLVRTVTPTTERVERRRRCRGVLYRGH
jgi:hypothetical protein